MLYDRIICKKTQHLKYIQSQKQNTQHLHYTTQYTLALLQCFISQIVYLKPDQQELAQLLNRRQVSDITDILVFLKFCDFVILICSRDHISNSKGKTKILSLCQKFGPYHLLTLRLV